MLVVEDLYKKLENLALKQGIKVFSDEPFPSNFPRYSMFITADPTSSIGKVIGINPNLTPEEKLFSLATNLGFYQLINSKKKR